MSSFRYFTYTFVIVDILYSFTMAVLAPVRTFVQSEHREKFSVVRCFSRHTYFLPNFIVLEESSTDLGIELATTFSEELLSGRILFVVVDILRSSCSDYTQFCVSICSAMQVHSFHKIKKYKILK